MKIKDIRGEDSPELLKTLQDLKKEQFQLSFRASAENVSNPSRHRQIRRTIARIKTILRERVAVAAAAAKQTPQES
jgi:large subunit ribosomal protein L29